MEVELLVERSNYYGSSRCAKLLFFLQLMSVKKTFAAAIFHSLPFER